MNTLQEWLDYSLSLSPNKINLTLDRVRRVYQRLNLRNYPKIVVAGTNGKGSTCAYLESIYYTSGYSVGCYSSPHLLDFRERIRLNTSVLAESVLVNIYQEVDKKRGSDLLTFFEFATLVALVAFSKDNVDIAILEVGLGGRFDAINALEPDLSIITNIALDHQEFLGDTRDRIGVEKVGIARRGKILVYGDTDPLDSIVREAKDLGASLQILGRDFFVQYEPSYSPNYWLFKYRDWNLTLGLPALKGLHQLRNAACALVALRELFDRFPVSRQDIRLALTKVFIPARFQILTTSPQFILDVAHDPHGVGVLAEELERLPPVTTWAIFSALSRKDIKGMIEVLASSIDHWVLCPISSPLGDGDLSSQETMMEVVSSYLSPRARLSYHNTPGEAFDHVIQKALPHERVLAFGSFHLVAPIYRKILESKYLLP